MVISIYIINWTFSILCSLFPKETLLANIGIRSSAVSYQLGMKEKAAAILPCLFHHQTVNYSFRCMHIHHVYTVVIPFLIHVS